MNKSILMQKQVKDNAEDLQKEFLDMRNWEEQMKRADDELKKGTRNQVNLPPVRRNKKHRTKTISNNQNENCNNSKRIKSYDYSAWEKFDVDKACNDVDKGEQSDELEGETMSKEELEKSHEQATKHKNDGNKFVQQQEWSQAVGCYSEAIKLFPYDAIFYANRALCQLKMDNFYSAESDCSTAIQLDEAYVKAYHRRAMARMNLKQYKEAKHDLEKVLKLESSNKEAKSLLEQVENKIKCSEGMSSVKEGAVNSSPDVPIEKKIGEKLWNNLKFVAKNTDAEVVCNSNHVEKDTHDKNTISNKQEDKRADVKDKTDERKRDPRIPAWLLEKDDVSVVEPITKPPHLRSKKTLTKIPVKDMDFNNISLNSTKTLLNENESTSKDKVPEKNTCVKSAISLEDSSVIPPPPKTSVRFIMTWKKYKSSEFRYKYLKQIPANNIPKIFEESMESDMFSEILEVLKIEFTKRKEPILCYLKSLSEVKRFSTLIMFIGNKEKEHLRLLFEYCKTIENAGEEEITVLQNRYEI